MASNVSAVNSIHFLCCFLGCNQRKITNMSDMEIQILVAFCMLHSYINIIIPVWTFSVYFSVIVLYNTALKYV